MIRFWDWNEETNRKVSISKELPGKPMLRFDKKYMQNTGNIQGLYNVKDDPSALRLGRIKITRPKKAGILLESEGIEVANNSDERLSKEVFKGESAVICFTIRNTGNTELKVFNVASDNKSFTLSQADNVIAPGEQTSFSIEFNSSESGVFDSLIKIGCNDLVNSLYSFPVRVKVQD